MVERKDYMNVDNQLLRANALVALILGSISLSLEPLCYLHGEGARHQGLVVSQLTEVIFYSCSRFCNRTMRPSMTGHS